MIEQEKIELELAQIENCKRMQDKHKFSDLFYLFLTDLLIDNIPPDIKSWEYKDKKREFVIFAKLVKILDEKGVFEGKKYFNRSNVYRMYKVRCKCSHDRLEPNLSEVEFIYKSLIDILKELGYETKISKKLCASCSKRWATHNNFCKICNDLIAILGKYQQDKINIIKSLILRIRKDLFRIDASKTPKIESEKVEKIYEFLYEKFSYLYHKHPDIASGTTEFAVNAELLSEEYLQDKLLELGYKDNEVEEALYGIIDKNPKKDSDNKKPTSVDASSLPNDSNNKKPMSVDTHSLPIEIERIISELVERGMYIGYMGLKKHIDLYEGKPTDTIISLLPNPKYSTQIKVLLDRITVLTGILALLGEIVDYSNPEDLWAYDLTFIPIYYDDKEYEEFVNELEKMFMI